MPRSSYSPKQRRLAAVAPPRDKITARQKKLLEQHSEHHSKKHMEYMKRKMREGDTFTQAHKKAQAKVGR